ncbi:MAG: A24 family peptidase [Acidimicrobiia bacterium]|nr:A24 family peptidase [Acidimicrobiia bacterium]
MDLLRLALVALAAVPGAWLAAVAADRIPGDDRLLVPRPAVPLPNPDRLRRDLLLGGLILVAFVVMADGFGRPARLVPLLFFTWVVLTLSAIDIDTLRLPDRLVLPSVGITVVLLPLASWALDDLDAIKYAALGGVGYFAFLLVAHLIYPPGMGFGDVKLSLLMGLYLGWLTSQWTETAVLVLYAMLFGFVLGSIAGIVAFIARGRSAGYPFGPFLAIGALLAIVLHEPLLNP